MIPNLILFVYLDSYHKSWVPVHMECTWKKGGYPEILTDHHDFQIQNDWIPSIIVNNSSINETGLTWFFAFFKASSASMYASVWGHPRPYWYLVVGFPIAHITHWYLPLKQISQSFPWTLMNFIDDHEVICLCIRWATLNLPNFATVSTTMAINMSNERYQWDQSAKINFKFS